MTGKYDYDAIVIGAGIGGLVCGCYLAKAGMKVLIVEKNANVGGYCTSFSRNGFQFDACAHSLGGARKEGNIARILQELGLDKKFKFTRHDPQDVIITPNGKVLIWNELDRTIGEFQKIFPKESPALKRFFNFIDKCNGISFNPLRRLTFQELLNEYFSDNKLKSILSLPILGNVGLPASKVSAFTATNLYKEFILDGGYYPFGGMQVFSDVILERFKELNGSILLPTFVSKIKIRDNRIEGIEVNERDFISAKYVVSNVDTKFTFLDLIDDRLLDGQFKNVLKFLVPSLSVFALYLGINNPRININSGSNIWFMPDYDIEGMYHSAESGNVDNLDWFLLRLSSDRKSIIRLVNCPFKCSAFWKENKKRIIELFIEKTKKVIPDLSDCIVFKDAATPDTLFKWTLNYRGAAYGWAGIPSQFAIPGLSQATPIKNLFLVGHWATLTQGIPGVAYLGKNTAKIIIVKQGKTK